jgi:glycogen(starch) synthase
MELHRGGIEQRRSGRRRAHGASRHSPVPPGTHSAEGVNGQHHSHDAPADTFLFEIAWEVCWQLGGIYTVLKTKAEAMLDRWGEHYFLIGPYNPTTAAGEFEEQPAPPMIEAVFDQLREQGTACHFGRWLVPGRPTVILLDHRSRYGRLHEDKYLMFADHGIATSADDGEVNDVIAFGFVVTEFFRILSKTSPNAKLIAHCHEWMGGVAIPRIAHLQIPVATVFTTHATLLGRYLAGDNDNFYDHLPFFHADAEADRYRILPRHLIEKAAAHASTVFTTVSHVTSFEASKLLGRMPDLILPNGIDAHRFEAPHELQHLHRAYKERINQFVMGHFFPSYSFDLDRTLYFLISGRYEYRNKGIDMFLEALWRLNNRLRGDPDAPNVVGFIVTKAPVKSINVEVLESQARLDELSRYCDAIKEQIGKRIFHVTASGRQLQRGELIDEHVQISLKRIIAAMKRSRQPNVVTHDLWDDRGDPILNHIRHRHLFNAAHDPVKVVYHPQFVNSTSPLLGMDYDQFLRGCHLGIFPSYYEPWGYTPMEAIVSGIPAITSNLSGFGAYVQGTMQSHEHPGLYVIDRRSKGFDQSADELAEYLYRFCKLSRRERIDMRNEVERLSAKFDWHVLGMHYHDSHDLAQSRFGARAGSVEVRMV